MSMTKQEQAQVTEAVRDIIWMARRYANGRMTYAVSTFNDSYDTLRDILGDKMDKATNPQPDEVPFFPYAMDGMDEYNKDLPKRKYHKHQRN